MSSNAETGNGRCGLIVERAQPDSACEAAPKQIEARDVPAHRALILQKEPAAAGSFCKIRARCAGTSRASICFGAASQALSGWARSTMRPQRPFPVSAFEDTCRCAQVFRSAPCVFEGNENHRELPMCFSHSAFSLETFSPSKRCSSVPILGLGVFQTGAGAKGRSPCTPFSRSSMMKPVLSA